LFALVSVVLAGCTGADPAPTTAAPHSGERHPVVVRKPAGSPMIPTGVSDEKGNAISVGCATCHTVKPANADAKIGTPLTQFHQGLVGKHGNLSCASCHTPADGYATLRLADGKSVAYSDVMTLCAQCHGPQFRDYQHGAHGGMTGHWDLTRGGRVRNNCIECHDPHAPKYPTVRPARGPNDRFQVGGGHD
jgi:formate-dependent nitrite reductase cytochrome c552 subunit